MYYTYLDDKERAEAKREYLVGKIGAVSDDVVIPIRCPHCGSYLVYIEGNLQCSKCLSIYKAYKVEV